MRICIPTDSREGLKAKVYGHFGSAKYFTIYDTEKNTVSVVENSNAHHSHGACHPIAVLGGGDIGAVICLGMGYRAVEKLQAAGIRSYLVSGETVEDVIKDYKNNSLREITSENACGHHGCH